MCFFVKEFTRFQNDFTTYSDFENYQRSLHNCKNVHSTRIFSRHFKRQEGLKSCSKSWLNYLRAWYELCSTVWLSGSPPRRLLRRSFAVSDSALLLSLSLLDYLKSIKEISWFYFFLLLLCNRRTN